MRNLITPDAVAKAVLDLAEPEGPKNVTARALAGELNVSVGALYNYAGSMQQALDSAEVVILDRLAASLSEPSEHPLLTWISENRGHAALLFELDRSHPEFTDEVREPLVDTTLPGFDHPLAAETIRNFLGMLITDPAGEPVLNDVDAWLAPMLKSYSAAATQLAAGKKPAPQIKTDKLMAAVHAFIDTDAEDPVRAAVRHETINILSGPTARGWNFRALSSATGLPLARLHMFGTRHDHLSQVAVDLVQGARSLAGGSDRDETMALPAALCAAPASLLEGLVEIFNLTNLNTITERSGLTAVFESLREQAGATVARTPRGVVTVSTIALLLAAFKNRDQDPTSWGDAPHLAALYLDHVYAV